MIAWFLSLNPWVAAVSFVVKNQPKQLIPESIYR